ncbi:TPA: hypothetical protein HA278_00800, partial [Candidatus Woesearchaeota archaeon]|nr:hypothetical protein [Candidatus Woesearchaeota archaeon]
MNRYVCLIMAATMLWAGACSESDVGSMGDQSVDTIEDNTSPDASPDVPDLMDTV